MISLVTTLMSDNFETAGSMSKSLKNYKLSNDELVHYLDVCPLWNNKYWKQSKQCFVNN